MMLLSVKMFTALLWGICVLFVMESVTASTPETNSSSSNVAVESDQTTTAQVIHSAAGTPDHKSVNVSVAATSASTVHGVTARDGVLATLERQTTEVAPVSGKPKSSDSSMVGSTAINSADAATSGSAVHVLHGSTAVTTSAGESSDHATASPTAPDHQKPATASTEATASSAAAFSVTASASSPQPASTSKPDFTSALPSTASAEKSAQTPVHALNPTSPSASTVATVTVNPSSGTTSGLPPTSSPSPLSTTQTSKTSAELGSTSQPTTVRAATSQVSDAAASGSASPSVPTDPQNSTTTANSSTAAGILIPRIPKRLPLPTATPATTTTTTTTAADSKDPSATGQPCSSRGVVKNCLIAIAVMAGVATIFMVSTIVLCAKLSARKYKVRKPRQETEMMCISALLPETNHSYTRQRNPVRNGVLVFPGGGDSDEDIGDNLTLSSFLPENDRSV